GFFTVALNRNIQLADFSQSLIWLRLFGRLIRSRQHSRQATRFEHRNIGPGADQPIHHAAAHAQRLWSVAAPVELEFCLGFEGKAEFSARIETIKVLQERVVPIKNFFSPKRSSKEARGLADHGERLQRLNMLGRLTEIAAGDANADLTAF